MTRPANDKTELTVLIAPSGFKESLSAEEVADRIAEGVAETMPGARIIKLPMADGGEGFTQALVNATGGTLHPVSVTGPVGQRVDAFFGLLGGRAHRTAVIEMAAAAGLRLVPRDRRNPMLTTSRGVGELIRAALDAGAERVLLGCGDSGINDGGAGMVQALGVRLLDVEGRELGPGGGELLRLRRIDLTDMDPRLARVQLDAAVNWHNVLLGARGVARVFGPQKGATPAQVLQLEEALERYAACITRATGAVWGTQPGSGASGGLGTGFAALLGGRLHPRYDIVMQYLELDRLIDEADLVITAEGSLDDQTPFGKVPAEVAARAKLRGLPVIALAGTIGRGVDINLKHGIDAFASMLCRPCTLDQAIAEAGGLLRRSAADMLRMVSVGMRLRAGSGSRALLSGAAVALACGFAAVPGTVQASPATSLSAGFETTSGTYGKPTRTRETVLPVALAHRAGPWRLRASAQLLKRVEGSAIAAAQDGEIEEPEPGEAPEPGAGPSTVSRSQSGPGDLNLAAFYTLWSPSAARPGLELGARLKHPLSSARRCLLTNGATDLTLEARARQSIGAVEPFVAVGWTKRGDPVRRDDACVATGGRTDLDDPFHARLGAAVTLTPAVVLEGEYEYRQKIRAGGQPKSELKLGAGVRLGPRVELTGYAIAGFSDASPDHGLGAQVAMRF